MNFQDFLSDEGIRHRSLGANRGARIRAIALHTRMKGRPSVM
jgi:hypothetical protein